MSAFLTRTCPHHIQFSVPTACTICRLDEARARIKELEAGAKAVLAEACHCDGWCGDHDCPANRLRLMLRSSESRRDGVNDG